MAKKNKIKQSDYDRVLITETLPFETPIIFSNDGLYDRIKSVEKASAIEKTIVKALVFGDVGNALKTSTIPHIYKIKKNSLEFRRLALLHPISQWKIRCFYEKYEQLILHYCSASPASIRTPQKVAGSFYSKSSWENINQYKTGTVSLTESDKYTKHVPSFFSYRGYDRLYKFFSSPDYFKLEKRFRILRTLDVSKCFDSIYTHCLSWATKDKNFTKENLTVVSTFGQEFDQTLRHGNHNETNGIPIGPEVSRIFAEILFQEIDRIVIDRLKLSHGMTLHIDYTFRRYVDDVFIFTENEDLAKLIYDIYSDTLIYFNLHANNSKSKTHLRPFLTTKSRLIYEAGKQANEFFDSFLEDTEQGVLAPKRIISQWRLTKSYIDSIKALCSQNDADYDDVASFLISVVTERIKKIVNNKPNAEQSRLYCTAIEVLIDVLFFLYSVAPSVGASYKLSTSIILVHRFAKHHLRDYLETLSHRIYELSLSLLSDQSRRRHGEGVDGFINLEYLNIIISVREPGDFYLLPEAIIDNLFLSSKELTYFTIVSCLFYISDRKEYSGVREKLMQALTVKLADLSDVQVNSEKAYLLLDMLTCPSISAKMKSTWIRELYKSIQQSAPPKAEIEAFVTSAATAHWQVNWMDVDLLNSLEKKELKQAY